MSEPILNVSERNRAQRLGQGLHQGVKRASLRRPQSRLDFRPAQFNRVEVRRIGWQELHTCSPCFNQLADDKGSFLQMGNTGTYVLSEVKKESLIPQIAHSSMSNEEAQLAANMPTVIRKLTPEEFERLFRHGFEVADYTLFAYHSDQFAYLGYSNQSLVER